MTTEYTSLDFEHQIETWVLGGEAGELAEECTELSVPTPGTLRFSFYGEEGPTFDFTFDGEVWTTHTGEIADDYTTACLAAELDPAWRTGRDRFYV